MKRLLILTTIFILALSFNATAQTADLNEFTSAFQDFADEAAPSIPLLADVGLRWSDAYIGNFPHFGVGSTIGFVVVPMDDIEQFFAQLQIEDVPQELKDLGGIPVPAIAVEGRIGGFVWPFDIGVKAGFIPESLKSNIASGVSVDYQMVGFDLRYRLVKEGLLMPEVSVGGGYTYLDGLVSASVGNDEQIDDPQSDSYLLIESPDVAFGWRSSVLDAKVQVSKNVLLILRPYAGLGFSYGISEVGGGYEAKVSAVQSTGDKATLQDWKDAYGELDELNSDGILVYSEANSFAMRAYLGTAVNLSIFKFDLSGTYNPVSQAVGAQFNVRAQF